MLLGYLRTEQVLSQMILRKKYETLVTQRGGEILFLKNEYFHEISFIMYDIFKLRLFTLNNEKIVVI